MSGVLPQGDGSGKRQGCHPVVLAHRFEAAEQPFGTLGHVLRGDGLGGLGAHLVGLVHEDLGLLFGVGAFALAGAFVRLALEQVALPVHVVDVDLGTVGVQQEHLVDCGLEQFGVVADHDQAALVVLEELPEPGDGVGVEVVGGFVEEHRLGVGVQDAGQFHTAALTAGKRLERLVQQPVRQCEVGADRRGFGLGGVTAGRQEFGFQPVVAVHGLALDGGVFAGHLFVREPELADGDVEAAGGQDPVPGQLFHVRGARVLRQVADLAAARDFTGGGQALAGQDPGQRGLACTVTADQADLVSLVDPEAHLVHEQSGAGAEFEILDGNQCS